MLAQLTPKERLGYTLLLAGFLFVCGFVGTQYARRPAEITLSNGPLVPGAISQAQVPSLSVPAEVVVDVKGAVKSPQVVHLPQGSRVADAIERAGGALPGARTEDLNLAAKLEDGTQLVVPEANSAPQTSTEKATSSSPSYTSESSSYSSKPRTGRSSSSGTPAPGSISLNTADAATLDRLPGVGPATAEKILEYRKAHGGFSSIEELLAVKGIGPKKLEAMRKFLKL
ncbi:MAG: ComEA family DNA-binding protein [Armatimonadetes bacterium]|nr:ComEA family DNA-binding protein [Armatimonadota bacterium]